MIRILFIDDDPNVHRVVSMLLPADCQLISARAGKPGLEIVRTETLDLVLLDIGLPDADGMEILDEIVCMPNPPLVAILSVHSQAQDIVSAMRIGAFDYFVKPITPNQLKSVVRRAARSRSVAADAAAEVAISSLLGESEAMTQIKRKIVRYAASELPVLVVGETGTGKELVAEAIHRLSTRHDGNFVPINCAAVPEALVESELFGSVDGAFTGAVTRRGFLEEACDGTLFLDEIGEMPVPTQAKLLRVLEDRKMYRVGGRRLIPVNIRLIAAANRNLRSGRAFHGFREDLYYRISALPLRLPPLRERSQDIPILVKFFLTDTGDKRPRITSTALEKLERYDWPGNVRELRNVVERAKVFCEGSVIEPGDIEFN